VGVGGFLGVGERYVVVDPTSIYMRHENGAWKVVVNVTKESLMAAPEFKYEEHKKLLSFKIVLKQVHQIILLFEI